MNHDFDNDTRGWALVDDIRAGRPGAFDEFHSRYASALRAQARRCGVDAVTVDDLVQETFVRAWRHITDLRPERGTPLAWLSTITTNLVKDYRKNAWTRNVSVVDHTTYAHAGPAAALVQRTYTDPDPIQDGWATDLLDPLLEMLRPNYRDLIERQMARVTVADEAIRLGVSEPAVKALRHRARQQLARYLKMRGIRGIADARDHCWGEGWAA